MLNRNWLCFQWTHCITVIIVIVIVIVVVVIAFNTGRTLDD